VDDLEVENTGNKAGADALNLVARRLQRLATQGLRDDRAGHRFDGDRLERRLSGFEHFADPGDRAAGADAADEDVDATASVAPNLFRRRLAMDFGVRGVLELLWYECFRLAAELAKEFVRLGDRAVHAF